MGRKGKGEFTEQMVLKFEVNANEGPGELNHETRVGRIVSADSLPVFRSEKRMRRM